MSERIIREDIRSKGEYQLTDALQLMLEEGEVMKTFPVGDWFDCGSPTALLSTNKRSSLSRLGREVQIPGSIIIPPVWIDPCGPHQKAPLLVLMSPSLKGPTSAPLSTTPLSTKGPGWKTCSWTPP